MKVGIECPECGEIRTIEVVSGPDIADRTPNCDCEVFR